MRLLLLECQHSGVRLGPDGDDGRRLQGIPAREGIRARAAHGRERGSMICGISANGRLYIFLDKWF